ncbi:MAG TPA: hypothetical protein VMT86_19770 [Bryobacteraceae bacterium]|nr:hypothetical protein [Bryobacteraceae bacterium]
MRATAIAVIHRGVIAVAGYSKNGSCPLHLVSSAGRLIRSFGECGGAGATGSELANGFLLWREREQRLLFVPRKMAEIQIYAADGTPIAVRGLGPIRPASAQWEEEDPLSEIRGVAFLPAGHIVVQSPDRGLLLFSPDVTALGPAIGTNLGTLIGADDRGGLYFLRPDRIGREHLSLPLAVRPHEDTHPLLKL